MHDFPGERGFHAYPVTWSPLGRLHQDTTRRLASGLVPRCPHPDEPALWCLWTGVLTCVPCSAELAGAQGDYGACHLCGSPATALAGWVVGGVACLARLCEPCHSRGAVPLTPN